MYFFKNRWYNVIAQLKKDGKMGEANKLTEKARKMEKDRYFVVFKHRYLAKFQRDRFEILDTVKKIDTGTEKIEDNFIFVAICNTFSLGGVMTLDETDVSLDDGEFELLTISMPRDILQLNYIVSCLYDQKYSNEDFNSSVISYTKVKEAKITIPRAEDWSLDGERGEGKIHNSFKVLHDAIQLIY